MDISWIQPQSHYGNKLFWLQIMFQWRRPRLTLPFSLNPHPSVHILVKLRKPTPYNPTQGFQ